MLQTTRRPLTLHVSALSNSEYNAYTTSLTDITSPIPDAAWEDITVGVREARGWIRGRYGVDGSVIDQILRYFCPELASHDALTGGQFFAALRLVCHAQSGTAPDESLVFLQANPEPTPGARSPSLSRPSSTKSVAPPPPPRPAPDTPALPPRTAPPPPSANPFARSNPCSSPPSHVQQLPQDKGKPASADPSPSNPFRISSGPPSHPKSVPAPAPSHPSTSSSASSASNPKQYASYTSPPLPPRKPSVTRLPPPRHGSFTGLPTVHAPSTKSLAPSRALAAPLTPPLLPPPSKPPAPPHPTSPLIKQSLQAAKGAQTVKEANDGLSRERRWEVIKKSAGGPGAGGNAAEGKGGSAGGSMGSGEGTKPRSMSPPDSFYDVAAARIDRTASPSTSSSSSQNPSQHPTSAPTRMSATPHFAHTLTPDTPPSPSPASGIPAPSSPGVTPRRAKSLQYPSPSSSSPASSPTAPPMPPPRRRRPESVQVTSPSARPSVDGMSVASPFTNGAAVNGHARGRSHSGPGTEGSPLARTMSSGAPTAGHPAVLDTLHRTLSSLRPGAGFESARVRAEGRVWPGGYVKGLARGPGARGFAGGGGERLVGDEEGDGGFGQDGMGHGGFRDDAGQDGGEDDMERERERARLERDELKMPVRPGEGWTAL